MHSVTLLYPTASLASKSTQVKPLVYHELWESRSSASLADRPNTAWVGCVIQSHTPACVHIRHVWHHTARVSLICPVANEPTGPARAARVIRGHGAVLPFGALHLVSISTNVLHALSAGLLRHVLAHPFEIEHQIRDGCAG